MGYFPEEVLAQFRGNPNLAIFFRMDTDPALHMWMGINDIPAKIEDIDAEGTVYLGAGRLLGIPELEVLMNGRADRVEFQLSGVTPEHVATIDEEAPDPSGAKVHVGLTALDDRYQPISSIVPIWLGEGDVLSLNQPAVAGNATPVRTVALSVGAGETTRSRASRSHWTAASQRAISPTDAFCDGVARLARGVSPVFPRF